MAIPTNTTSGLEPCEPADGNRLLEAEVETWKAEARDWRLQYLISHSFVQSLTQSPVWKLLRPLRVPPRLPRRRGGRNPHRVAGRRTVRATAGGRDLDQTPRAMAAARGRRVAARGEPTLTYPLSQPP